MWLSPLALAMERVGGYVPPRVLCTPRNGESNIDCDYPERCGSEQRKNSAYCWSWCLAVVGGRSANGRPELRQALEAISPALRVIYLFIN
jgi:hypothetical protein